MLDTYACPASETASFGLHTAHSEVERHLDLLSVQVRYGSEVYNIFLNIFLGVRFVNYYLYCLIVYRSEAEPGFEEKNESANQRTNLSCY